jgi:hypothetical protein
VASQAGVGCWLGQRTLVSRRCSSGGSIPSATAAVQALAKVSSVCGCDHCGPTRSEGSSWWFRCGSSGRYQRLGT